MEGGSAVSVGWSGRNHPRRSGVVSDVDVESTLAVPHRRMDFANELVSGRVRFLTGGPYRASGFFASVIVVWRPGSIAAEGCAA